MPAAAPRPHRDAGGARLALLGAGASRGVFSARIGRASADREGATLSARDLTPPASLGDEGWAPSARASTTRSEVGARLAKQRATAHDGSHSRMVEGVIVVDYAGAAACGKTQSGRCEAGGRRIGRPSRRNDPAPPSPSFVAAVSSGERGALHCRRAGSVGTIMQQPRGGRQTAPRRISCCTTSAAAARRSDPPRLVATSPRAAKAADRHRGYARRCRKGTGPEDKRRFLEIIAAHQRMESLLRFAADGAPRRRSGGARLRHL